MIEGDPVIDREVADGPRKTFDRVRSDTLKQLETAVSLTQGYQPLDPHFGDVGIMMALGENFARVTEIANRSNADGRLIDARNSIQPTHDAADGVGLADEIKAADALPPEAAFSDGDSMLRWLNESAPPQPAPDAMRLRNAAKAVALHRPLAKQVCHVPSALMHELVDALISR